MKTYKQRKDEYSRIVNNAGIIRAFTKEQLEQNENYKKAKKNNEKLINYCGGIITENNYKKLINEQLKKWDEFNKLKKNDNFLFSAFQYEFLNHEAQYGNNIDMFEYFNIKRTKRTLEIYKKAWNNYLVKCSY